MAERVLSPTDSLKQLEQQLTCPVCLECYTQPRTLPCLHSFCHQCLVHFPVTVEGGNHCITCPVCRQTSQQPDNGVSGYQPAFIINNLLDLHELLKKVSGSQQNSCENCHKEQATGYCKQCSKLLCPTCIDAHNKWGDFSSHQILGVEDVATTASKLVPLKEQPTMECTSHGSPLMVYCDTCDKLICQLCTTAKAHRNHEYEPLTDAFPRHKQQIVDNLQKIKEDLAAVTAAIKVLENQKYGFLEQVQAVRREIETTVQQLVWLLQESERQLMKELDQVAGAYVEKISARQKEADITVAQLKSCEEFAEEELRIGSQQEIMVMKRQMVERMRAVCSQVKEDNFQPLEETRLRFVKSTSVVEACRSLGGVIDCSQVRCSLVKTVRDKTSFDLCSAASNSPLSLDLVSCQLSPVADSTIVFNCVVQQVAPNSFEVHYCPPTAGPHQLRVQVGGANVLDTPLTIEVMPRRTGRVFKHIFGPHGIALTQEGHLVVAESNNGSIAIVNTVSGEKIRSFGRGGAGQVQFSKPRGVALSQDGHFLIVDQNNHRLQVVTVDGTFVSAVGSRGSQPLQFLYPRDVAVHKNGKIFISDKNNDRVQVLNTDLSYAYLIGTKGSLPGEFDQPHGITIDSDGMVYVADYFNNRVQKFTTNGSTLAVIDRKTAGSRLNRPVGLCVDSNNILYVTEWGSNTVCMFSTSGRFLGYVGSSNGSSFKYPRFITSDKSGKLYISDENGVVTY